MKRNEALQMIDSARSDILTFYRLAPEQMLEYAVQAVPDKARWPRLEAQEAALSELRVFNYFFWRFLQDEMYEAALKLAHETAGRFMLFGQFCGKGSTLDVDSIGQMMTSVMCNLSAIIEMLAELKGSRPTT